MLFLLVLTQVPCWLTKMLAGKVSILDIWHTLTIVVKKSSQWEQLAHIYWKVASSLVDNEADDFLFQACIYVLFPLKSLGEFRRDHKNSPSARTYRLLNHFNLLKRLHFLSKTVNQHAMRAIAFIQIWPLTRHNRDKHQTVLLTAWFLFVSHCVALPTAASYWFNTCKIIM